MSLQPVEAVGAGPRPAVRIYTGQQTAEAVGLSWERFRKVRETWTRDRDFPAEINEPGEPVRYLADPVDRWLDRRTRRVHAVPDALPLAPLGERRAGREGRGALRKLKGV